MLSTMCPLDVVEVRSDIEALKLELEGNSDYSAPPVSLSEFDFRSGSSWKPNWRQRKPTRSGTSIAQPTDELALKSALLEQAEGRSTAQADSSDSDLWPTPRKWYVTRTFIAKCTNTVL